MTFSTRIDLNGRHAGCGHFVCVNRNRGRITLNDANFKFTCQAVDGLQDETGFPAPGDAMMFME